MRVRCGGCDHAAKQSAAAGYPVGEAAATPEDREGGGAWACACAVVGPGEPSSMERGGDEETGGDE
jgi:hypothetical protein